MSGYAVVFYPDLTLRVEVVGPFRSAERAQAASDRLELRIDMHGPDSDIPSRAPHVVRFLTEREAADEYDTSEAAAGREAVTR